MNHEQYIIIINNIDEPWTVIVINSIDTLQKKRRLSQAFQSISSLQRSSGLHAVDQAFSSRTCPRFGSENRVITENPKILVDPMKIGINSGEYPNQSMIFGWFCAQGPQSTLTIQRYSKKLRQHSRSAQTGEGTESVKRTLASCDYPAVNALWIGRTWKDQPKVPRRRLPRSVVWEIRILIYLKIAVRILVQLWYSINQY